MNDPIIADSEPVDFTPALRRFLARDPEHICPFHGAVPLYGSECAICWDEIREARADFLFECLIGGER